MVGWWKRGIEKRSLFGWRSGVCDSIYGEIRAFNVRGKDGPRKFGTNLALITIVARLTLLHHRRGLVRYEQQTQGQAIPFGDCELPKTTFRRLWETIAKCLTSYSLPY